jgi:hypothetical protein
MPNDRCPNCGNPVGLNSSRCSFCGQNLPQLTGKPWISYVRQSVTRVNVRKRDDVKLFTCPFCHKESLFKVPGRQYYECLYLPCKATGYSAEDTKLAEVEGDTIFVFRANP